MAEMISALAGSSEHLVSVAAELDVGAREGVERNEQLRVLEMRDSIVVSSTFARAKPGGITVLLDHQLPDR